jgi:hypothetical protein
MQQFADASYIGNDGISFFRGSGETSRSKFDKLSSISFRADSEKWGKNEANSPTTRIKIDEGSPPPGTAGFSGRVRNDMKKS